MIKNFTISEFEAAVTTRVLLERLVDPRGRNMMRTRFTYAEALSQSVFAANDVLMALGINRELWVRVRGRRAYMFHEETGRIVAELGVITDSVPGSSVYRRRLHIELFGRGGRPIKEPTIGDLSAETAKLGEFRGYRRPRAEYRREVARNA